jgi:transposase
MPGCSSASFIKQSDQIPEILRGVLDPVLRCIEQLTLEIRAYDQQIEKVACARYPETKLLRTAPGIGPVTALAYVTTLEDPSRFTRSRQVGPYLGLVAGQKQSGSRDPQRKITKAGDPYLRQLLVGSAHYLMGPFGPESALRHWGLSLAARGGKNAKKRAAVAVARKLAVLLHRLWVSGEVFQPFPTPVVQA